MESVSNFRRFGTAIAAIVTTAALAWFGNGLDPVWALMWIAPLPAHAVSLTQI